MAFEGEDFWVESMGFGSRALWSSQDFFMASVLGIEDGLDFGDDGVPFVDSYDHNNLGPSSSSSSLALYSELENQRVEMDLFLQLESKRLRKTILEEQKRHQASLALACESRIRNLILHKDHELSLARNRARELQERLRSAEIEAAAWEKKATEKEAVVSALRNRLTQVKNDDDTLSICDSSPSSPPSSSSSSVRRCGGCKLCRGRLCVVLFPCRHLCCCRSCEPLLGRCPICQTVKEASAEVFFG